MACYLRTLNFAEVAVKVNSCIVSANLGTFCFMVHRVTAAFVSGKL